MTANDDATRRAYWTRLSEEAHSFMMNVLAYPVAECGEGLASLADAAREAGVEAAFSTRPHAHGLPRVFVLREGLIARFVEAADRLNRRGWVLRVEDGFRSRAMQKYLGLMPSLFDHILETVAWELGGTTPEPDFFYRRLLTLVAQIPRTGTHMSGSAMDVSVLDRVSGVEIDRGGPYPEMTERTPMASPFISPEARRNREEITAIMRESGFVEYPYEFWHYSSGDAYEHFLLGDGRPAQYGAVDFDPATKAVTPIEDPQQPLNSLEEIEHQIQAALERRCRAEAIA
jgi:D-alanyl-D-alanine dipeptidase